MQHNLTFPQVELGLRKSYCISYPVLCVYFVDCFGQIEIFVRMKVGKSQEINKNLIIHHLESIIFCTYVLYLSKFISLFLSLHRYVLGSTVA